MSSNGSARTGTVHQASTDPDLQRYQQPHTTSTVSTTVEIPSNHVAMVSHPDDVVQLIETAALRRSLCRSRRQLAQLGIAPGRP